VANTVTRLVTEMSHSTLYADIIPGLFKTFNDDNLKVDYPLSTGVTAEHQRKGTTVVRHIKCHPEYFTRRVGGNNVLLLKNKICIPETLM
jgi:hypothetical protein